MSLSSEEAPVKRRAIVLPFRSDAAKSIVYQPFDISVAELAQAANAPPLMDLTAVTVTPVFGACVVESVMMNWKPARA